MPSFDKLKFTANGLALQANAQAGSQLTFTKIKLGKGTLSGSVNNLADLVNPAIEANIITGTLNENVYTVQANATNAGLADGFYWTELGLFAKDNKGKEVLYAYASTTDETDYIPSESESSYMKRVKIALAVGNATDITIVKSDDTYIDVLTFNEKFEEIKALLTAMGKQISGCATTIELDNVKTEIEKQITDANEAISNLEKNVNAEIKSIKENYATAQSVTQLESNLGDRITGVSDELSEFASTYNQNMSNIGDNFANVNSEITSIKSSISALTKLVEAIPSITSGTADPSGGKDGDVYIQHE